ncbi:MAG: transcription-repair coupling factor [Gammaproteobacteria bacterium]
MRYDITQSLPLQHAKPGKMLHWGNLTGISHSLVLSTLAQQNTRPVIALTQDNAQALQLKQELQFFSDGKFPIIHFADRETLPYDHFSPHQELTSQRLLTLYSLPQLTHGIVVVAVNTLLHYLPPQAFLWQHSFVLTEGQQLKSEQFKQQLVQCGYRHVNQVIAHGEFAMRGSILDVFPMGSDIPLRIDLFDEEIDSIRSFDPDTQLSDQKIPKIELLPAYEFPLTESAINLFRKQWREQFSGNPTQSPIYQTVSDGFTAPGIEYYLPLFFEECATLLDYLPENSLIVRCNDIVPAIEHFWQDITQRYEQLQYDISRPLLPPKRLFIASEQLLHDIKRWPQLHLHQEVMAEGTHKYNFATHPLPTLQMDHRADNRLNALQSFMQTHSDKRLLFCAETPGRREALLELLQTIHVKPKTLDNWPTFLASNVQCAITVTPLTQGTMLEQPNIAIIPEAALLGRHVMQRRATAAKEKALNLDTIVRNLAELQLGAPVVHIEHGVGRYQGLQTLTIDNYPAEFLTLEYANNDKLYVPVTSLHLINRYSGVDPEHAPLHKLGSEQWTQARKRAAEKARDVAAELLEIYAQRAAKMGHQYNAQDENYQLFASEFPFELTLDQEQAINQVVTDMRSTKTMDRLICGDVGFGKTEVAMRAAFIAANNHKQVAILVPTTLLAQQHYQSFQDRFANWPIKITLLSRFRSAKMITQALEQIAQGKIDIVIGTHKLLSDKVKFRDLGLVIIDEEHRFGVRQKEYLKALRTEVDILTLTATPIPRTLNMALSEIRDLSIIATPPAKRLAIKTFVQERNKHIIRESILREISRGGQVFFVHNNVATIEVTAQNIRELVPEARINVGHGQMPEKQLEAIMADFYHQRFNVLVCTTIIETGIDIPTANTIIIDRADRFGLAQLHQLRGRVGRSHHQAYAYLMTPGTKAMTADAIKRLDAITSLEDLGAGFNLATHDLEIRGVGELLGEEQSGNIQNVGFSLYMELLEQAVQSLRDGTTPDLDLHQTTTTEINLQISALIPEDYMPDIHTRLIFYKRIANAKNDLELDEIQVELIDRFGLLPPQTKTLFAVTRLKLIAYPMGITKIDANPKGGKLEFNNKPHINTQNLIQLIQKQAHIYKLDGPQILRFKIATETPQERIETVHKLLEQLSHAQLG